MIHADIKVWRCLANYPQRKRGGGADDEGTSAAGRRPWLRRTEAGLYCVVLYYDVFPCGRANTDNGPEVFWAWAANFVYLTE